MPNTPHDIYETRNNRSSQDLFRTGHHDPNEEYWARTAKRKRRQSFVLGLLVFLVVTLVAVITFQQYMLSESVSYDAPAPEAGVSVPIADAPAPNLLRYLGTDMDDQTRFMIEELQVQSVGADAAGDGDKPLHSHWIKEAAYHLLHADRARREGLDDIALASYENALRIYPDMQGINATVGMMYMERRTYRAAAEAFERALLEEAMSFGVVNNLAVAYLQLGELDKAEENLLHALRLRPEYAAAHFNLASLYVRRSETTSAAAHFRAFLEMEPDNLNASLAYASILIQHRDWARAAELLERAARLSPNSPPIYFRLAQCLAQVDRRAEAMQTLRRAVSLVDPRNALAWMSQNEFDALRSDAAFQRLVQELGGAQR